MKNKNFSITFLGATQQVTGSCLLVRAEGLSLLVDCGLYQEREHLHRNWEAFSFAPEDTDAVLLTHVHLDHSGLLPKLVREGFRGPILTTDVSKDLLPVVLLDSAHIQEEDASYKKKRHKREGRTGPHPEKPLYTVEEVQEVFPFVQGLGYRKPFFFNSSVKATFHDAGHILGSSIIELTIGKRRLLFTGDLGKWDNPIVQNPATFDRADYIVLESTYGDRDHSDPEDPEEMLARIIRTTAAAGGNVVVPTFAMERAQDLLVYLHRLFGQQRIPRLPVFLDSPMAVEVLEVFSRHISHMDREAQVLFQGGRVSFSFPWLRLALTPEESRAINDFPKPCVILAGSGMCTGGRIKHHLRQNISRPECVILFVGYQAQGTLGRTIDDGAPEVRIHGRMYPVRARIEHIHGFSAHAGQSDIMRWLGYLQEPPRRIFLVHGEREKAQALSQRIQREKGWSVVLPDREETWHLD